MHGTVQWVSKYKFTSLFLQWCFIVPLVIPAFFASRLRAIFGELMDGFRYNYMLFKTTVENKARYSPLRICVCLVHWQKAARYWTTLSRLWLRSKWDFISELQVVLLLRWRVSMSVCQFVCPFLFVCLRPLAYLSNHTSKFQRIFCTYYLMLWLVLCRTAVQYVMYFRFCGLCQKLMFSHNGAKRRKSKATRMFLQFSRWRHRSEVYRLSVIFIPQHPSS